MAVDSACWVITNGAAGNENQALALAHALDFKEPRVLRLRLRAPWRWLAPTGPRDVRSALPTGQRSILSPPWPTLAIGCGRTGALATLGLKRLSGGATHVVQILDPRRHRDQFDALIVPEHDRLSADNVITCLGALNAVDDDWLARGRTLFPRFADLPSPRTAVLFGGPIRGFPFDRRYMNDLFWRLARWHERDGGSFLATGSRRTPPALAKELRTFFSNYPGIFWGNEDDDGGNPYPGLLSWADRIVVTTDSANLLSEACATGVPVVAHMPQPVPGKLGTLAKSLIATNRLRVLEYDFTPWSYTPLRELDRVASMIKLRLSQR